MNDLETLRPEVREAINRTDVTVEMFDTLVTVNRDDYDIVRAELLRLQSTESRANEWQLRAEKAEAELAALKARMKPCARVRDGEVHVYMDTVHEGKEVAVVVVED